MPSSLILDPKSLFPIEMLSKTRSSTKRSYLYIHNGTSAASHWNAVHNITDIISLCLSLWAKMCAKNLTSWYLTTQKRRKRQHDHHYYWGQAVTAYWCQRKISWKERTWVLIWPKEDNKHPHQSQGGDFPWNGTMTAGQDFQKHRWMTVWIAYWINLITEKQPSWFLRQYHCCDIACMDDTNT
jgi:hypothetical protein